MHKCTRVYETSLVQRGRFNGINGPGMQIRICGTGERRIVALSPSQHGAEKSRGPTDPISRMREPVKGFFEIFRNRRMEFNDFPLLDGKRKNLPKATQDWGGK